MIQSLVFSFFAYFVLLSTTCDNAKNERTREK